MKIAMGENVEIIGAWQTFIDWWTAVFLAILSQTEDPRDRRGLVYSIESLLTIAICTYLCNGNTFEEMEVFAETHREWLREKFGMQSVPCADTFNRLFQALAPEAMTQLLSELAEHLRVKTPNGLKTIAVDGKTVRGSVKNGRSIHILNAWAGENRIAIGQLAVDSKSNEITHVPQLLRSLNLKNAIVTADALNTQAATAQTIIDGKGAYVLPIKKNHPTHRSVITAIMDDVARTQQPGFEQVEKGHGRLETRRCWATEDLSLFLERDKWPGIRSLARIDRARRLPDGTESKETALFISSLPADAATIATAVRQHWGVENQCHWCLDIVFREDDCRARTRNAARNLSALRVVCLNILRHSKVKGSLRIKRFRASFDISTLEQLLFP